ncbi:MAG: TlpA disulfide reductase family protein [Ferruginibacter sp.]
MHKVILTLLTGIFLLTKISGHTIISGSFKSFPSTDFRIVCDQSALNEFQGENLAKGKTNASGEFNSTFEFTQEQAVILFISNRFFRYWIIPDKSLTVDETNNGEFIFSGDAAKQNNFFYRSGIMNPMSVPAAISSTAFEAQKQVAYLDSITQKRWTLFNKEPGLSTISKKFTSYCKGEIIHFPNLNKNQYVLQHIYGAAKIKRTDIPPDYYKFWDKFQFLDDSCASNSYQNSLRDYIGYFTSKQLNIFDNIADKDQYYQLEFKVMDSLLGDLPYTRERVKGETLLFLIKYFDLPQTVQLQFEIYKKEFPLSPYAELVQKKWDQKIKNILTVPVFSLKDVSGNIFDIKSLRGKVVYIDFWGSWCKPCLAQMANSALLQKKYKGKNVAFLFIDFYDTKEQWLNTIRSKNLEGIFIKAEKEDEAFFDSTFGVKQGFPRYALLDKNGVLITASAPHPNDAEATLLIDKYLQ